MKTMLFNPYSGLPRHPSDIASDPAGVLMVDPDEPLLAAPKVTQPATTQAVIDVLAERQRQIDAEGWTPEHDSQYSDGQLECAAACYAGHAGECGWMAAHPAYGLHAYQSNFAPHNWPWNGDWWKPSNPRRDLVKSAALALAAIERFDRAGNQEAGT